MKEKNNLEEEKERQWRKIVKEVAKSKKFFLKGLNEDEVERAIHLFREFCLHDLQRNPNVAEEMLLWKAIDSYLKSCRSYPETETRTTKTGTIYEVRVYAKEQVDRNREVIAFLRELKLTPLSRELPEQKIELQTAKKIVEEVFGKYDKKKK